MHTTGRRTVGWGWLFFLLLFTWFGFVIVVVVEGVCFGTSTRRCPTMKGSCCDELCDTFGDRYETCSETCGDVPGCVCSLDIKTFGCTFIGQEYACQGTVSCLGYKVETECRQSGCLWSELLKPSDVSAFHANDDNGGC